MLAFQATQNTADFVRTLLLLLAFAWNPRVAGDTSADTLPEASADSFETAGILHLSEAQQELAGIITQLIPAKDYLPEKRAFGTVLSLAPLLEISRQIERAQSQRKVAAAKLAAARTAYRHVRDLYNDQAIARFKLDQSEMEWIGASAGYEQAVAQTNSVRIQAIQNWGEILTEWAADPGGSEFSEFVQRKSVLLSVSLPAGESLPQGVRTVFVHRGTARSEARPAELISSAPVTAENTQGESYFFQSRADELRSGMNLYVWIPEPGETHKGVEIPSNALVWRDGRPWTYLKVAPDSFLRHIVEHARDQSDRWFLGGDSQPNAEIVVLGGQTLLSREFHWQIPNEDDD
ncbi:MAG: hypothetical protein ACU843_05340 [Gammaproteobacteria bacterium]